MVRENDIWTDVRVFAMARCVDVDGGRECDVVDGMIVGRGLDEACAGQENWMS